MEVKSKNISVAVKGLDTLDQRSMAAAAVGLHRGLLGAVGIVQRQFLGGPRPLRLDVRSTRLRNSVTQKVETGALGTARPTITGAVGSNVVYAARHEFGFCGTESVRGHWRVIQQLDAFGGAIDSRRVIRDRKKNFVGFKDTRKEAMRKRRSGLAIIQFVKPHSRKVNYKGRPFARPGVLKAVPIILSAVNKELKTLSI